MKKLLVVSMIAVSSSAWSAGPTGLGPIKIGMTKDALESLTQGDGVRIDGALSPYEYRNGQTPSAGVDKFTGNIIIPDETKPLSSEFSFKNGMLARILVTIANESTLISMKKQISEKYGKPEITDSSKEEDCIYRNGANFKLKQIDIVNKWTESIGVNNVTTRLSAFSINMCPVNLRYGHTGETVMYSLSIFLSSKDDVPKQKNIF